MAGLGINDFLALSNLLQEHRDDETSRTGNALTPGSFGAAKPSTTEHAEAAGFIKKSKKDPKDIWDDDEVPPEESITHEDLRDQRPRPKYF